MAQRIVELHRVLKPTGSLYLQIDPTASHYLKIIIDRIFGKANFRNEIVWCYSGPGRVTNHFKRKHDTILFYAKSANAVFDAEAIRVPYKRQTLSVGSTSVATGKRTRQEARAVEAEAFKRGKIIEDW